MSAGEAAAEMLLALESEEKGRKKPRNAEPPTRLTYPSGALPASSIAFVFSVFSLLKCIPQPPLCAANVLCLVDVSLGLLSHCYFFRAKRQNALKPPGCRGYFSLSE